MATDTKGYRYSVVADGLFVSEKLTVASVFEQFEAKGVVSCKRFEGTTFDSVPVALINTRTGFLLSVEDKETYAFAIDDETGAITDYVKADTAKGAIISLSMKMGTVIYDNGDEMIRGEIASIDENLLRVAGIQTAMGNTPKIEADQLSN
jgi:hypothetical protein